MDEIKNMKELQLEYENMQKMYREKYNNESGGFIRSHPIPSEIIEENEDLEADSESPNYQIAKGKELSVHTP